MKITHFDVIEDRKPQAMRLMIQSEGPAEAVRLLNLLGRIKAPVASWGSLGPAGNVWGWIVVPLRKGSLDSIFVSNGARS